MLTFTWGSFIAAAIKSLPLILQLIQQVKSAADAKANQGIGYDQAVADGLRESTEQLAQAREAVDEARRRQEANPGSDDGRDPSFRRD